MNVEFLFAEWAAAMDFAKRYNATPVLEDGWWVVRPPRRAAPRIHPLATWYRRNELTISLAVLTIWIATMIAVFAVRPACGQ
jgi:hypothetical protein